MTIEEIDAEIARLTALREKTRFANLPTPPEGWSWKVSDKTPALARNGYDTRIWISGPRVYVIDVWGSLHEIDLEPLRVLLSAHGARHVSGEPSDNWIKVAADLIAPYLGGGQQWRKTNTEIAEQLLREVSR